MRILLASLLIITSVSMSIGWPLVPFDQTHKIDGDYGHANIAWEDASPSNEYGNFHSGIDLHLTDQTNPGDEEIVYAVEQGWITEVMQIPDQPGQWLVIICETLIADEGWAYLHIEDLRPNITEGNPIDADAEIGGVFQESMTDYTPHLHFQRSYPEWTEASGAPEGLGNPLEWLLPPLEASFWHFIPQPGTSEHPWCYFLADLPIAEWDAWGIIDDFYGDTLSADELQGSVDIIQGFSLITSGEVGTQDPAANPVAPYRIEWDCVKLGKTTDADEIVFNRRVVSFEGNVGAMDDYEKYQQFYFRFYKLDELFPDPPVSYGDAVCITNCGDAVDWDGINNIEESCWNTALNAEGTGESYHPLDMVTRDGPYRIDVTAYAWDTNKIQEISIDCELHNTKEIAQEVHLTDAVTDQDIWHAEWVATYPTEGFAPYKSIYTNTTFQPGSTMDIEIIYSGPMSTTVTSNVRFTKPDEPYLTATPSTPEWTSTNQPDGYFDTWHGTVDVPVEGYSGWLTMEIKAKDISDIGLLDPSIADPDPPSGPGDDEYTDDHHGFGIAFGIQPGWPVTLHDNVLGSPVLADLDGDGDLDVVIQSRDGFVHILDDDGSSLNSNWPMQSGGWGSINVYACPSIVDLDGDGDLDVLSVYDYGCNARDVATGSDLNEFPSDWPVEMGDPPMIPGYYPSKSSPAIGDVDGDGYPEMVLCRHLSGSVSLDATVYLYEHTGGLRTWARNLEPGLGGSSVASTPAISGSEIVVCTVEGWATGDSGGSKSLNSAVYLLDAADGSDVVPPAYYNCWFWASPVVADIDNDGVNEIIIGTGIAGTSNRKVLVLNGNTLDEEHVWNVGSMVRNPVAIGDMNDDGILDVVAVDNSGTVNCWSGEDFSGGSQYDPLPGFPVTVEGVPAAPSIADIDGDSDLEIIVGTGDGYLYAINSDGSICSGYPVVCGSGIYGQVAIGNIDDDNSLEMILADDIDPLIYCYDLGAGTFPAEMPWRQFQHDSWHTGCFEADNTIPSPPTNLQGEHTDGTVLLTWDLSVNDFYSQNPEEPTDVIYYEIWRGFPPYSLPFICGRVHAGVTTYTDDYGTVGYPRVKYELTAHDGTNRSDLSNAVHLHTEVLDVISLGCSVVEEFSAARVITTILQASGMQASEPEITEESSHVGIASAQERTTETLPTAADYAVPSTGNPGCLTDGSVEVCYSPSPGADVVVIDLGEECTVTSIMSDRVSIISSDASARTDESIRVLEAASVVELSLQIEVAGSDRIFYPFTTDSRSSTQAVRYIRICGASGLSEISVYGSRGVLDTVSSVEITRSDENEGWMFAIPVAERSEEAEIRIYDVSGRMIWSGYSESGSVLHWDGYTGDRTPVPNGVYLLQCSIGSQVSTGSFVVRRD